MDDTVPGLQEGRAIGAWVVGLAVTGNMLGLSEAQWLALPEAEQQRLRAQATAELLAGGRTLSSTAWPSCPARWRRSRP